MSDFERQLKEAHAAVAHAQDVRAAHRHRTSRGSPAREQAINGALERIAQAMRPIRHYQGQVSYVRRELDEEQYDELRAASASLQTERRKLWKMRKR